MASTPRRGRLSPAMLAFTLLVPVLLAVRASAYYELPFPRQHLDVAQVPLGPTRDAPAFPPIVPRRATPFAPPSKKKTAEPVIDKLTAEELEEDLRALTSFHTRHGKSENGHKSELWLLSKINEIADAAVNGGSKVEVVEFKHDFAQPSIIARFHGSNTSDSSVVILGAHQDSKNYRDPTARAPGADDDGSGTVTILSAFRGLANASFKPEKTVEFHWYAAEEEGLFGSRDVAMSYKQRDAEVAAMVQFDMTGWLKNGTREVVGIVSSETDLGLTAWQAQLVETYTDLPSLLFHLPGHAGSDHMWWNALGYPSSFLAEGHFDDFDPNVHTPNDSIDISPEFSFKHMLHFSKLAAAFAIEQGGWASD